MTTLRMHWRLGICMLALAAISAAAAENKVLFSDSFDGKLAEGWTWIKEVKDAWKVEKGDKAGLTMKSLPGNIFAAMADAQNRLSRPLPKLAEGLSTEVRLTSEPKGNFEQAVMIWSADDDNYVKLCVEQFGGKPVFNLIREEKGKGTIVATVPTTSATVVLRMTFKGGKVVAEGKNGEKGEWKAVGSCAPTEKPMDKVTLGTLMGVKDQERWVTFAAFQIVQGE